IGPGQNGVYDIKVVNFDGKSSILDPLITNPSTLQFSYASFLYLGSQEDPGKVYGYAQHPTTGALLNIVNSPFSITGHAGTYGVVIHPNNKYIYAANVSTGTVSAFSITPQTGKLVSLGAPIASGGNSPNGLFFHPTGRYLYVTNQTTNDITGFYVASDGTLTTMPARFPTTGALTINGIVVSADGKFLYAAANGGYGGVASFTIDSTTGFLTSIPGTPFINKLGGDSSNPGDGISIHPNGKWLYMGLVNIHKISVWSIDQITGVLTPVETPILNNVPTPFNDNGGSASTVSDDGLFLYGTAFSTNIGNAIPANDDPKKIVVYAINQTTGGLTRVSNINTGGGPNDVRIDTTGKFAYTCNSMAPASVSAYSVNKMTGTLTALTPRDYAIPGAPSSGPGIMVIQRNTQTILEAPPTP
ncbi:MAG: beta-propeller fold lactonase family protein, partial [Moraxellaceae bacterium]|nr:beta-propeller fold lactonase family protein [Pseudobdellovibrionaceae bacterium]